MARYDHLSSLNDLKAAIVELDARVDALEQHATEAGAEAGAEAQAHVTVDPASGAVAR